MRWFAMGVLASLCAACATPAPPDAAPTTAQSVGPVDPVRIDRVRSQVPDGYEVTSYTGPPSPITLWGMGDGPVADPPECLALAVPPVDPTTTRGWSASGPGGIIYAVVAATTGPTDVDCPRWELTSTRSSATVTAIPAPALTAARSDGMKTEARTVVEGGTETHTHADTFVAHLDGHLGLVTVVTDPGATHPPLTTDFAADLFAETVAALRS
ncbi:DUF5642 family protein [Mycobacterium sp. pV006]|uniref:DUF5642 family protein n=1 Tax=Mycobacterium sp. pV006 TaxID=3238983 RepID=UPI00351B041B